jgi:diacylglycerol O-acyltransferase
MERLTPLAAAFLDFEDVDPSASLAIGSFTVFDGPAPAFEDFLSSLEGRLPLIPRYRQRLRTVPFDLAAPAWVDDPDFDVRWHVRNTGLPSPGGPEEIGRLMSRVMSRRMDRRRPLWEYWFVEGLPDGRWGVISKLHHCLADGVSGSDLFYLVLDPTPTPRPAVPDDWVPVAPASTLAFTVEALRDLALAPFQGVGVAAHALRAPRRLVRTSIGTARGLLALAGATRPVHGTSLTGPVEGSRRYTWTELSLDDIRVVRKAFGATVNDVALAAVSGGFRRLLLERGEEPDPHALRSLVPVSTRAPGADSELGNQVSLLLPFLPVDEEDPRSRLAAVQARIRELRDSHEPEAGGSITSAAELGPFGPVSWLVRAGMRFPQRQVATVTTNVPGPPDTLYGLGREVVQMLPYVPIADRVRIGIVMYSYRGTLTFGLTGDYSTTPDLDVLASGISESARELIEVAGQSRRTVWQGK